MATLLIEQVDSRQMTVDQATGRKTIARIFKGPGVRSEEAARAAFYAEGHEVYPADSTLRLIRVTATPMPSGAGQIVTAEYENKVGSRFSPPPREDPDYYHFGWLTKDIKVKLPFSRRARLIVDEDSPEGVEVWVLNEIEYVETRIIRPYRVRVRGLGPADLDVIATERRKIHTIRGREYLYLGADVQEVDGDALDITHSWEIDNGTPFPQENSEYRIDIEYPIVSPGPPELMRLPYTETVAVPPVDPRTEPFGARPFYPYARNPNGWRLLPGADRL
jgi:hypothetical protein